MSSWATPNRQTYSSSYNLSRPHGASNPIPHDSQSFEADPQLAPVAIPQEAPDEEETPREDLFLKAHRESSEAGLIPLVATNGCRRIPHSELDQIRSKQRYTHVGSYDNPYVRCPYPHHYKTQAFHKKIQFPHDCHERVEIRKLLSSRIDGYEFDKRIKAAFPELACYKYLNIIAACYQGLEYRKRWLVVEEDRVTKKRYFLHRDVTEQSKIEFKTLLGNSVSLKNLKTHYKSMPVFRHMTLYDILMTVYSGDFYQKNLLLRQCGPISGLAERVIERYRLRENALISPASEHINSKSCVLSDEQKFVVIGLMHRQIEIDNICKKLAELFVESFSPRSTIDILNATFGSMLSCCVEYKVGSDENPTNKPDEDSIGKPVVELAQSMKRPPKGGVQNVRETPSGIKLTRKEKMKRKGAREKAKRQERARKRALTIVESGGEVSVGGNIIEQGARVEQGMLVWTENFDVCISSNPEDPDKVVFNT